MTSRVLSVIAALTLVGVGGTLASADRAVVGDPDDSPGGYDIIELRHSHTEVQAQQQDLLKHVLVMAEDWSFSDMLDGDSMQIFVTLDDDRRVERRIYIDVQHDASPYAAIEGRHGVIRGYAKVWQPTPNSIAVQFPSSALARDLGAYGWYAYSLFHNDASADCGNIDSQVNYCPDRAPDHGFIWHRRFPH